MFPSQDKVNTLEVSLVPILGEFFLPHMTFVLISSSGKSICSGISSKQDPLACTLLSVLASCLQHVIWGDPCMLQHVPAAVNSLHYY